MTNDSKPDVDGNSRASLCSDVATSPFQFASAFTMSQWKNNVDAVCAVTGHVSDSIWRSTGSGRIRNLQFEIRDMGDDILIVSVHYDETVAGRMIQLFRRVIQRVLMKPLRRAWKSLRRHPQRPSKGS